jgi:hypothetical protein
MSLIKGFRESSATRYEKGMSSLKFGFIGNVGKETLTDGWSFATS